MALDKEHFEKYIYERTVTLERARRITLRASRRAYLSGKGERGRKFMADQLWKRLDTALTPMMTRAAVFGLINSTRTLYRGHENCAPEAVKAYDVRVATGDFGNSIYNAMAAATKSVYDLQMENTPEAQAAFEAYFTRAWNLHTTHDEELWEAALDIALLEGGRAWSSIQEAHTQQGKRPLEDSDDWNDSDEGDTPVEDV